MLRDTPEYLEAPDNEDSEALCECGEEVDDDGRYPYLCYVCNDDADREAYYERLAEERADREMFPEYERDYDGEY